MSKYKKSKDKIGFLKGGRVGTLLGSLTLIIKSHIVSEEMYHPVPNPAIHQEQSTISSTHNIICFPRLTRYKTTSVDHQGGFGFGHILARPNSRF